ncbi:hypothetical protein [Thalassotalea atypica]|uniref:hypothetical protein n=1 Tax=Thalassotalea atypica TaxID=2054316 RepID=UPI002572243B|nr:hypothetical protein [Thalassotalea atypica]
MKKLIIIGVVFTLFVTEAIARYADTKLKRVVENAESVVKIEVTRSIPHYWFGPYGQRPCGYTITANILENFKGDVTGQVTFGSQDYIPQGKQQLVFLYSKKGAFASHVKVNYAPKHQASLDKCLVEIPPIKVGTSTIMNYDYEKNNLYPSPIVVFPEDISVNVIEVVTVLLNNKEVSINDIPFEAKKGLPQGGRSNIRYVSAQSLENWLRVNW